MKKNLNDIIFIKLASKIKKGEMSLNKKISHFNFLCNFKFRRIIKCFKKVNVNQKIKPTKVVWTMWWDGIENAPEIVKLCLKSLKLNSKNSKIIIINKYNYNKYIYLPPILLLKLTIKQLVSHIYQIS